MRLIADERPASEAVRPEIEEAYRRLARAVEDEGLRRDEVRGHVRVVNGQRVQYAPASCRAERRRDVGGTGRPEAGAP